MSQKVKAKQIIADKTQIRTLVLKTIDDMAKIVGSTMGPGGSPVLIERDNASVLATKDGVTVAKNLGMADAAANTVVDACKEIAINTAKEAGDGTTTAIVLGNAIVKHGQSFLKSNPKYSPQRMINDLQGAYRKVIVPYLQQVSMSVSEDQLKFVATISANGDQDIADAVVKAVTAAGDDGTVLINESPNGIISVETLDGYVITTGLKEHGQIGPVFINDKANQQVKMDNGYVVLYDGSINDLKVPGLIQDAVCDTNGYSDGTPIIVFAHSFADSVLDKFAKTTKGGMTVVPVKTPRSGLPNGASMFLHDMAAYTGAVVYDPGNVDDLDDEGLGHFDSATVNMYESFIIGTPDSDAIEQRIVELKAIADAAFSEMDRSFLRAAIAKLTGGVSTILVGGSSDLEIREKKDRVEDAVEAVRSAIAEGIVTGGCSMHLQLIQVLRSHPDFVSSWEILCDALMEPITCLMNNCGETVEDKVETMMLNNMVGVLPTSIFDAMNHDFVNPMEAGIIEPTKVVRVSISNALSVASLLTTLGGIIVTPRNADLEMQMDIANQAFSNMMNSVGE
jgi:chaperonin GroEL